MSSGAPANNLIGVFCAIGATLFFSVNDMAIKFLSGSYALHEVVLIRTILAMMFMLVLILPFDGGFRALKTRRLPIHLFRGLCVVVANMTFFLGLAAMPLASASAIFFIAPLIITVFSVIFLDETVGPRRWAAVAVGLVGVLIMLRPGSGSFQFTALLPLVAAFAYASLQIMTRKMRETERAVTMAFYIQITFIAVSAAMGLAFGDGALGGTGDPSIDFLLRGWVAPDLADYPIFLLIGFVSGISGFLISQAYRLAEAGFAAPFEYLAMPLAIFWGVVVFGEWPDTIAWLGISLIVGGGLYTFWRETRNVRAMTAGQTSR